MEALQQQKQYEYRANSNLVLTLENRPRDTGPTGEVTSLVGKVGVTKMIKKMGDRVSRDRPPELEERLKKAAKKEKKTEEEGDTKKKFRKHKEDSSVLSAQVDAVYRPQTKKTQAAYEVLLNFIQHEMGDKPHDVLRSAADEVIGILKDDHLKSAVKKKEIESLFKLSKPMDDDRFQKLFNVVTKITDWKAEAEQQNLAAAAVAASAAGGSVTDAAAAADKELDIDEEHGVPVVFDGEEDQEDADEVKEGDSDEDEGVDADRSYAIQSKMDNMIDEDEEKEKELDARVVDAFWIQRHISNFYKDPHTSQSMSEQVFALLSSEETDGAVENKLVLLLEYDKFKFIKLLLRNRQKVVYCTKLARAKDDTEKQAIEKEMLGNSKLRPILEALHKTSTAADRQIDLGKTLLKEARSLKKAKDASTEGVTAEAYWTKRPKAVLDLDSLSFEGGHFMSNPECKLPAHSEIVNKKGYQEVHIPPLKSRDPKPDEQKLIKDIPEWAQPAFPEMKFLNMIQTKLYKAAMFSAENLLLCAPTGAGKTNVAMLAILRELQLNRSETDGTINLDGFKIIYIAPMKSLVQEVVANFGNRLKPFGIEVKELSGDVQLTKQQIDETQIIVSTPEKWDIITRKSGDRAYTQLVKLIIIDEVHLLHDSRGPVLESIVSRTIRQIESTSENIRLVGLSATLPNYEDVAMFLRVKPESGLFFFDNSFRPVPLQQQFIGITQKKAFKRFQMMNQITYEKVSAQAGKNQVLIFVHSRKETGATARALRELALEKDELSKFLKEDSGRRELLTKEAEGVKNEHLKELLPYGFGIHHAGMVREDRTLVEELFTEGHIQVLVSTATLAWGVNLPAHTVIIKGTQIYNPEKGRWVELSPLDVMQMVGRAGRPQYDVSGEGIIITSHKELHYYLSLLNEQLPIESQFISRLADNLNAEIVLGTVQNVKEAVTWLGYTYLYVRMLRKPTLYGVSHEELENDPVLEQRRVDLIHTAAILLDKHNLVKYDRKSGNFQVTDLGRVASHYYITHQSMAVFNEYLKPTMSDIELFRVFSLSSEFKYMSVREEEKMELAKLLDKVPIPIKESIEEPSAKVNVLLQAYISRLKLEGFALVSDMVYITQSAGRIMRALFEIVLKRGWAAVAVKCLNLCKMISHRMWGAQSPLRQFKGIPPEVIKRIEGKDFPWERFYDLDAAAIGELIRIQKLGRKLHKCVHQLPRLELICNVQPITRSVLRVELTLTPDFDFDEQVHGYAEPFWIIVEDVDGETVLHHEYFILRKKYVSTNSEHVVSFTIPIYDPLPPQYYVRVVSDRWLGSEVVLPISFRHLILPERYPPPTELLDLQPLNVTELGNENYIKFYTGRFELFNPIQTQCFNTIYKRDDSTLVAAPTGSGKTVLAELAIMRMLSKHKGGRCVYVAPLESLVVERYHDWKQSYEKGMGIPVTKLTGETSADLKLLQEGQIVLSTPQIWDVLSRRWKTRKNVQTVKLFIVDELHLIGGEVGPVLEVIVSRMRYIASQTEVPIRILGLSTSVANAKDLGEWIGATATTIYNFHPNVRPVPLEIRIQGFDIVNFYSRQLAMVKPTYFTIAHHSPTKPVIIFVPSRKQARKVALDMMTYASTEENPQRFLHCKREDIKEHLKHVGNKALKVTLDSGVGFYHEGLTEKERAVVEKLFTAGAIQVVVAEYKLCWGMTMSAHLVVIMGTQVYDGREHRYTDVPITDVVQMMGRASRPLQDSSGKCTIFCQTSKKEFYKKFLYEPFPVESHLNYYLHDHMVAEIITKRIENVQDAVDYLTWSFFYRRITQNPNYYGLQGVSHRHLSDHLSELVEEVLGELKQSRCINIEDETDLSPLNLGMIAAYYYIRYTTVEKFSKALKKGSKLAGLLGILSSATEFEQIQVRHREDYALKKLSQHLPLPVPDAGEYNDAKVKTNLLLQAHFERVPLAAAAKSDLDLILPQATRLLQAMVDVISSSGWLTPALAAMELSQMITQGMWNNYSPLTQLPHIDKDLAKECEKKGIEGVPDLIDMEDVERTKLLGLSPAKMQEVAAACNAYPDVELKWTVQDSDKIRAGGKVVINVSLERDPNEEEDTKMVAVPKVCAPRYPGTKFEGWWLVVGNSKSNELISIKRVAMKRKKMSLTLEFAAPSTPGGHSLMLYFMSDSYMGCDQEYEVSLKVGEAAADAESSDSDSEGEQSN